VSGGSPLKIAILGVGGVGGYFGGRLAQSGAEVTFICRGEHLAAIRERGLRVESIAGDFVIHPARATDRPEEIGPVDFVLICVKAPQLEAAARQVGPLLGPQTLVVPTQNTIESIRLLPQIVPAEHVVGGFCRILSSRAAPGLIRHVGATPDITFAHLDGHADPRLEALRDLFTKVGVTATIPSDIVAKLWEKLIFVATLGGIGALARAPIGIVRTVPECRAMLEAGMREIEQLGLARGIAISPGIVESYMGYIDRLEAASVTSMHRDLQTGRPSELYECVGALVQAAREIGHPVPIYTLMFAALLPVELRSRGELAFPDEP